MKNIKYCYNKTMQKGRGVKIALGIGLAIVAALTVLALATKDLWWPSVFAPNDTSVERDNRQRKVEVVARNLDTPWALASLPGGNLLATERGGQMRQIGGDGRVTPLPDVVETGEGGLLGLALHPDFSNNNFIYVYYSTDSSGQLTNRIDRYELKNGQLSGRRAILENIPAASNHNGGTIKFGPDDKLYVTTGDAGQEDLAQDRTSLAGKILRLNDDGSRPADNPFDSLVWSYGHRNPQGIAWDSKGRLWSVEHGPSGLQTGRDELNLIEKGANYGWPTITGSESRDGMRAPIAQSGEGTWAPSGMAYLDGSLYFAGLRGQALYRAKITGESVQLTQLLSQEYGRLRAVEAVDGVLYVTTSNRDGRGSPVSDDDRVLRLELPSN